MKTRQDSGKKRSTLDQLFKLSQSVSTALKKHKKAVGVFLDVKKAFDAVWIEGLKYKLSIPEVGIPTNMIRLLSSFLTNRHLRVHQDNTVSNKIELKAGTPQGSALSPILPKEAQKKYLNSPLFILHQSNGITCLLIFAQLILLNVLNILVKDTC